MKKQQHLLAILACLLWSTAFAGVKFALNYSPPLFLAALRFSVAGLVLLPWFFKSSQKKETIKAALLVGFMQTFLQYGTFTLGLSLVEGAVGAIIIGSGPLVVALLNRAFLEKKPLPLSKWIPLATGLAGVCLISLRKGLIYKQNPSYLWGIILLGLTVLSSSIGSIIVAKNRPKKLSPFALNSMQFLFGGLGLLIVSLFTEGTPSLPATPAFWLPLLWLVFLSTGAFSIWFSLIGQKNISLTDLSFWKFLLPIFGAFWAWIFIPAESPDNYSILGILLIGTSVAMFFRSKKKVPS